MERYLADLRRGRIDPQQLPHGYAAPRRDDFDPASYLQAALAGKRLPAAAREAAPRIPQYERLREALAKYRLLVDRPAWNDASAGIAARCRAALRRSSNLARPGSACRCCGNV